MGKKIAKRAPENRGKTGTNRTPPIGRRFQKGVSGNPGGRPRTALLSQAVRQKLGAPVPDDLQGRTHAQFIADALVRKAMRGNPECFRVIGDRTEGKATQPIAITASESMFDFSDWTRKELREYAERGIMPQRFAESEVDGGEKPS